MNIDNQTSLKINALRFPLICTVVFIHMGSNYSSLIVNNKSLASLPFRYIVYLFTDIIGATAVPLFFSISGFLFFSNYKPTLQGYFIKIKSRMRSLLLPYLFWNLSYFLFKLIIQLNPSFSSLVGGSSKRIVDYSLFDYFDALFGWTTFPISYQFWFIRDLIFMIVLSPLIWLLTKHCSWLIVLFFTIIWSLDTTRIMNIHNETWVFFSLGCLVAIKSWNIDISENKQAVLLKTYAIIVILAAALAMTNVQIYIPSKILTILGVVTIWYCSGRLIVSKRLKELLLYMSAYSFFIYAAHEPLLSILAKLFNKISFLQNYTASFLLYFILPILTIISLWLVGTILKARIPKFYNVICGSR